MELGHQFQLFTPPTGPAKMTEWADVDKPMRPVHDEVDEPRSITPVHVEGYGDVHPYTGLFRSHPHERQLQMLMSAREIRKQYAPAEGDRMYSGTDIAVNLGVHPAGMTDTRAGEITDRRATTDFRMNERWGHPVTGERFFKRTAERKRPPIETDAEMWHRKVVEADEAPQETALRQARLYTANNLASATQVGRFLARPLAHDKSLIEHLQGGGDPGVIPLGTRSNPLSSSGKPMLAGGHHRVAALGEVDPDRLVPVEHWRDVHDAKYEEITTKGGRKVSLPRRGYT